MSHNAGYSDQHSIPNRWAKKSKQYKDQIAALSICVLLLEQNDRLKKNQIAKLTTRVSQLEEYTDSSDSEIQYGRNNCRIVYCSNGKCKSNHDDERGIHCERCYPGYHDCSFPKFFF